MDRAIKAFAILYSLLLTAELICCSVSSLNHCRYYTKPTLLLSLFIFFITNSKKFDKKDRVVILCALGFSWFGDVCLLFENQSSLFFIAGLTSFLLAHIFYCINFLKYRNPKRNSIPMLLGLGIYGTIILLLIMNNLQELTIPVVIYMTVILIMIWAAYMRAGKVSSISYVLVFLGALLFVISDSILAMDKFYSPVAFSSLLIMSTYGLAQFSIVIGLLKQR